MKTLEELKMEMDEAGAAYDTARDAYVRDACEAAYNAARDAWDVYAVARDTYNEKLREKR